MKKNKLAIVGKKTVLLHIYGVFNKNTDTVSFITMNEDDFDMELPLLDDDVFQPFESNVLLVF